MAQQDELREQKELMLSQAIKEMLYAFRKNGGDLDYCVQEIRKDFEKADYKSPEEVAELQEEAKEEISQWVIAHPSDNLSVIRSLLA